MTLGGDAGRSFGGSDVLNGPEMHVPRGAHPPQSRPRPRVSETSLQVFSIMIIREQVHVHRQTRVE